MAKWIITEWDGVQAQEQHELPGHYSEAEVGTILQRLACRTLSVQEIIAASRRANDSGRTGFLDPLSQTRPIQYGHGDVHFTADYDRN